MGKILAVCISEKKGTLKKEVGEARLIETLGWRAMPTVEPGTAR